MKNSLNSCIALKRLWNSSVKINADKKIKLKVSKVLTRMVAAATTVAIVPLCVNMAPFGKP